MGAHAGRREARPTRPRPSEARSASGLACTGGSWTDTELTFSNPEWPGTEQQQMIEEVAKEDEMEQPPKLGCVIS